MNRCFDNSPYTGELLYLLIFQSEVLHHYFPNLRIVFNHIYHVLKYAFNWKYTQDQKLWIPRYGFSTNYSGLIFQMKPMGRNIFPIQYVEPTSGKRIGSLPFVPLQPDRCGSLCSGKSIHHHRRVCYRYPNIESVPVRCVFHESCHRRIRGILLRRYPGFEVSPGWIYRRMNRNSSPIGSPSSPGTTTPGRPRPRNRHFQPIRFLEKPTQEGATLTEEELRTLLEAYNAIHKEREKRQPAQYRLPSPRRNQFAGQAKLG